MRITSSRARLPRLSPATILSLTALVASTALACSDGRPLTELERNQFSAVTASMAKVMELDPQSVAQLGAAGFLAGSPANLPTPVLFDFDDKCLTTEDDELRFSDCEDQLGGFLQGSVRRLGDRVRGNLLYVASEGTEAQDTTLTIGASVDVDLTFDGRTLDGSMSVMVSGLLSTEGYNVRGTLTFGAVELDDEACAVGGATTLEVSGAYSGFGYKGGLELRFGPACGDIEGEVTGDLAIGSGGQDTSGAGNGTRLDEQGAGGSGS